MHTFAADRDRRLWPGEFVDVTTVIGEDKDVVTVPVAAVQTGQRGSQVFVVKPDHSVELRPVEVTRQIGQSAVLRVGVNPGETVVVDGQLRLTPGAKVENKPLNPAGADKAVATSAAEAPAVETPKS